MEPWLVAALWCGGLLLLILLVLALRYFLRAGKRLPEAVMRPFARPYAHRGLFGEGVPENSLAAFERAAANGFAIELDVQLSADGEVFVFHDYNLKRMCGKDQLLSGLTAEELRACRLAGSAEKIPTLADVLQVVNGRVPILMELKGESGNVSLCPAVAERMAGYRGEWCVESFNPLLLRWFYKHKREIPRGLLVTDLIREKKEGSAIVNRALSAQVLNFLCRPGFVAFDRKYPGGSARKQNRKQKLTSFVYTVRDGAEYEAFLNESIYPIFEGFLPR